MTMRLRRSMLFMPGNNPNMLQNAGVLGSDTVILDLEDAVAPGEKDAARFLVAAALAETNFYGAEKVVRINSLDSFGRDDLAVIVPARPDGVVLPKVQEMTDIQDLDEMLSDLERRHGVTQPIAIFALIETPLGLCNALPIARASKRLQGLLLGAEDYTAAINAIRTKDGQEILYAREALVAAAYAAGVQAVDTPFTDIDDEAGLEADTRLARQIGFTAKLVINPRQLAAIHAIFTPSEQEIAWAKRVVRALEDAKAKGLGAVAVDGKMVDLPIVTRANRILNIATTVGLI